MTSGDIDDLRCLRFWLKKYACTLRGRPKLQSSHDQTNIWPERCVRDTACCYDQKCQIFVVLLGVQTKERQTQSQILVVIEYLSVLIQKVFLSEKRWIAAIRRENWTDDQTDNSRICSKYFISGKSKKTLIVSRSLVFLFIFVAF